MVHFIGILLLIAISYDPLYFCGAHCNFFSFSKLIKLRPLSFVLFQLMSLAKSLSILFISSKNYLFVSLIFFSIFLAFIYLCALIFIMSLGFVVLLYLLPLDVTLAFLLKILFISLDRLVLL